jgi:hypothetical protein
VRDQYAGDISDLLKLAFLRALATGDKSLGVAWYYNPEHDGRIQDGRHREYCDEAKWEVLDLPLLTAMKALSERSVRGLADLPIWPPGTRFHSVPVARADRRRSWTDGMEQTLRDASIVFLDPDNGLGHRGKHAKAEEVMAMRRAQRAVILIKFPGRTKHDVQLQQHHRLLRDTAGSALSLVTVRTYVSVAVLNRNGKKQHVPRTRWFTIVDADEVLVERAREFARKLNQIKGCGASLDVDLAAGTLTERPQALVPKMRDRVRRIE